MTWFKVDDNLSFHRKTVAAGNAAMGLWVRAGSWCGQHLTDGFIPDHMIATLGTPAQKQKLVAAGFWIPLEGGCQFHGWNEKGRQPTSKSVLAEREKNAARQAKHRSGTYEPGESQDFQENLASTSSLQDGRTADEISTDSDGLFSVDPQVNGSSNGVSSPLVTGAVTGGVTGAPSRPDQTREEEPRTLASLAVRDDRFDDFYAAYPRRQDRRSAERAWKAALKRGANPDAVVLAAAAYARMQIGQERRFIKLPATWLNAGAYDNEPEPSVGALRLVSGNSPPVQGTSSQRANAFLALRQGTS